LDWLHFFLPQNSLFLQLLAAEILNDLLTQTAEENLDHPRGLEVHRLAKPA
jgi:hypothetical protein